MFLWENVHFPRFFTYEMTTIPAVPKMSPKRRVWARARLGDGLGHRVHSRGRAANAGVPWGWGDFSHDFTIENGDLLGLQQHGDFMRLKQWTWGTKWDDVMGWDKVRPKKFEVDLSWAPYHVMTRRIRWFLAINSLGIQWNSPWDDGFFRNFSGSHVGRINVGMTHDDTIQTIQILGNSSSIWEWYWMIFISRNKGEELGWNHERIQVGEMMGWDDSICGSNELPPLNHWSLTLGSKWGAGMLGWYGCWTTLDMISENSGIMKIEPIRAHLYSHAPRELNIKHGEWWRS